MAVAEVNEDYAFSDEYLTMYNGLKDSGFKVDVKNKEFMFEMSETTDCSFITYPQWNKLIKKIVSI